MPSPSGTACDWFESVAESLTVARRHIARLEQSGVSDRSA